ncbi:SPASM domain-containing protein [Proteiniphilum sp. X52]|uniref:SPASM domain-containing protein n=1 Tax=Proteiniphilum sp. X52 TaxID=2382159 RepID=UPI000F0A34BE|nr:SPASM domain-containing protein [Proteiniphilum sp. X52]RNC63425.1 SPASM domain-containing protein [Proteiniphilum sp. X52]
MWCDDEKCKDCLLLPICMGGCPLHRIKNKKEAANFNLCSARKDNLNKFLEYHYGKRKMQNSTTTPTLV